MTQNLSLHPLTQKWFDETFRAPTEVQKKGWQAIRTGHHTLIAAPTGSGKTLTAFLVALDELIQEDLRYGGVLQGLSDETRILYVSPLKALSHDVQKNLERPLQEIQAVADRMGVSPPQIRTMVRTGDTPQSQRTSMLRKPPHILVTTPESLFLLLTTDRGRSMLATVKTVIIDEIHALIRDKRGAHLILSLARLDRICPKRPQRIGLSATQKPLAKVAQFLTGKNHDDPKAPCHIVNVGHRRTLDLGIEAPPSSLSALCSHEQWAEVYGRLVELIQNHTSTLIFVNTRKMAERVSFHLAQILGEDNVQSHHGSLSREIRLEAEDRLKTGRLKALVATASLELGIDVGHVDLVCQIGSPRTIATFLQRVGRAGHSVTGTPKGRLFVLTRDELVEATALMWAINEGELDALIIPEKPLDILAQQVIAEASVAPAPWESFFELATSTYPYRDLSREEMGQLVNSLAQGYAPGRERRSYVTLDRLSGTITARKGARLAALTSGGAIPELGDFRVVTEDEGTLIGSVNEEFAIESSRGDIFLLGSNSWQIVQLKGMDLVVRDAHGAPPTIPFWFGEAPGRSPELSRYVGRLREKLAQDIVLPQDQSHPLWALEDVAQLLPLDPEPYQSCRHWLEISFGLSQWLSLQLVHYVAVQKAAIGVVPTAEKIVFERFFDETGGMQLVIHAPLGIRINRGFGLALRKRFCRSFDFELQASADNDGVVLSLSEQQSFPIEQLFSFLNPENVTALLEQAILQAPLFNVRWRWNTNRSLAVLRSQAGKKVPPVLQRFRADDLMTAVFPAQTQCKEHLVGDVPIPDHPLVRQTMHDCLWEAIDLGGLIEFLEKVVRKEVTMIPVEAREPSPFAYQLLNAMPYAFLDDAPLEERRTRALTLRRTLPLGDFRDLAQLSPEAVALVRGQVRPAVQNKEDLAEQLSLLGVLNPQDPQVLSAAESERHQWFQWFLELKKEARACELHLLPTPDLPSLSLWVSLGQWDLVSKAYEGRQAVTKPQIVCETMGETPGETSFEKPWKRSLSHEEAVEALIKAYLDTHPIVFGRELVQDLGFAPTMVEAILAKLESQGALVRGFFTASPSVTSTASSQAGSEDASTASFPEKASNAVSPGGPGGLSAVGLHKKKLLDVQWCERRLLARLHKLTIENLRSQIKPVGVGEYYAYLCSEHHAAPGAIATGQEDFLKCLSLLEGFQAPAGSWETEILGVRLRDYQPRWLDEATLSGQWVWGRFHQAGAASRNPTGSDKNDLDEEAPGTKETGSSGMSRVVSLGFAERLNLEYLVDPTSGEGTVEGEAGTVYSLLERHGALFFSDLLASSRLLQSQLETQLSELTRRGLIHADGFGAIRPLVTPQSQGVRSLGWPSRKAARTRRFSHDDQGRFPRRSLPPEGRWSLFPPPLPSFGEAPQDEETYGDGLDPKVAFWAELLLRRYGVMFKALLAREQGAPRWGQLLRVFRILEARGEIRGGQFVAGPWGEQFATEATITKLRSFRGKKSQWTVIHASDLLNLVGILLPGERLAPTHKVTLAVCDGEVVARSQGDVVVFLKDVPTDLQAPIRQSLLLKGTFRSQYWARLPKDPKAGS